MRQMRKQLIRLGSKNPHLRPHIRPILASPTLKKAAIPRGRALEDRVEDVMEAFMQEVYRYAGVPSKDMWDFAQKAPEDRRYFLEDPWELASKYIDDEEFEEFLEKHDPELWAAYNDREDREVFEEVQRYIERYRELLIHAYTDEFALPSETDLARVLPPRALVDYLWETYHEEYLEELRDRVQSPQGWSPGDTLGNFLRHTLWRGKVLPEWEDFVTEEEFDEIVYFYARKYERELVEEIDNFL